jgi:MarR family transcriptional regulator for hemolysin
MPYQFNPDSFGFVVTDVARLLRAEMDRRIGDAGLGLTAGEGRALTHAARAGLARQTVIAERMGVEAMTLSAYLDRLEQRGLIERIADPADRRAKLVRLTPEAQDVLSAISSISAGIRADLARAVPPEEFERLSASLRLVRDELNVLRSDQKSDAA